MVNGSNPFSGTIIKNNFKEVNYMKIKIRSKFVTLCSIVLSLFILTLFSFSKQIGWSSNQSYIIILIGGVSSCIILSIGEKMRLKENKKINEKELNTNN